MGRAGAASAARARCESSRCTVAGRTGRCSGPVWRPWSRELEDAGHQVVFVDAPHELPMGVGDEVPMRTWWSSGGGDVRDTTGWDTSLEALREMWTSRGPFQGIIGFSQGASAGLILCELADAADGCFASLRCAVLCAGYVVPSPARAVPNPIVSSRIRAMIIAGDADEAVPPADTLACAHRFHSVDHEDAPGEPRLPFKVTGHARGGGVLRRNRRHRQSRHPTVPGMRTNPRGCRRRSPRSWRRWRPYSTTR